MATLIRGRSKSLGLQRQKKRQHHIVPWIENPCVGADEAELVFHQRHEANTVELFFDLFFVANLATFTSYHSVTGKRSMFAYIGFFAILWTTWFQVTLHDVRFARDTIYERVCKTVQFIVFVGFALVGSAFEPGDGKGNNTNFRILCYTLVLSRILFAVQYGVVLGFTAKKGYNKLLLPLGLNVLIYVIAAVIFGAMTPAFSSKTEYPKGIFSIWWIVMLLESMGSIAISSIWRMLSFKKTHIVERMALLTLIVIGEGAIGVTKTISRMMSKNGLDAEGCSLVICIILVLVFLWMLYFDNHPKGHYGTIRQQIWSVLHFPLHLAIVGVVEGSQQIALARYVIKQISKFDKELSEACRVNNLDGMDLQQSLNASVEYFQFSSKVESERWIPFIDDDLFRIGQNTDICSPANTRLATEYPEDISQLLYHTMSAVYASLGMKLDPKKAPVELAIRSWHTVYEYYWSSALILLACMIAMMYLIRKNKADIFDWVSLSSRGVCAIVAIIFLGLSKIQDAQFRLLESPAIVPIFAGILLLIIILDRLSAVFSNWRLRRSGEPIADDHEHGHGEHQDPKHEHAVDVNESRPTMSPSVSDYNPMPIMPSAVDSPQAYATPSLPHSNPVQTWGHYQPVNHTP
ncbi:MAG: hypothetical protein M1816_002032 [Peltula sp. TS41687]|nr:MAG: hypothetical protein M1816_002032 [Peltula sp. TS41687]